MSDTADPARSRTIPQTARKSISPKETDVLPAANDGDSSAVRSGSGQSRHRRRQVPDHGGRSRFAGSGVVPYGMVSSARRGTRRASSTTGDRSPHSPVWLWATGCAISPTRTHVRASLGQACFLLRRTPIQPPGFPGKLRSHTTPTGLSIAVMAGVSDSSPP